MNEAVVAKERVESRVHNLQGCFCPALNECDCLKLKWLVFSTRWKIQQNQDTRIRLLHWTRVQLAEEHRKIIGVKQIEEAEGQVPELLQEEVPRDQKQQVRPSPWGTSTRKRTHGEDLPREDQGSFTKNLQKWPSEEEWPSEKEYIAGFPLYPWPQYTPDNLVGRRKPGETGTARLIAYPMARDDPLRDEVHLKLDLLLVSKWMERALEQQTTLKNEVESELLHVVTQLRQYERSSKHKRNWAWERRHHLYDEYAKHNGLHVYVEVLEKVLEKRERSFVYEDYYVAPALQPVSGPESTFWGPLPETEDENDEEPLIFGYCSDDEEDDAVECESIQPQQNADQSSRQYKPRTTRCIVKLNHIETLALLDQDNAFNNCINAEFARSIFKTTYNLERHLMPNREEHQLKMSTPNLKVLGVTKKRLRMQIVGSDRVFFSRPLVVEGLSCNLNVSKKFMDNNNITPFYFQDAHQHRKPYVQRYSHSAKFYQKGALRQKIWIDMTSLTEAVKRSTRLRFWFQDQEGKPLKNQELTYRVTRLPDLTPKELEDMGIPPKETLRPYVNHDPTHAIPGWAEAGERDHSK